MELVDQITKSLDIHDLRNLRLSCTALAYKTFHQFGTRFFATKSIKHLDFFSKSFQSFLAYVKHSGFVEYTETLEVGRSVGKPLSDLLSRRMAGANRLKNLRMLSFHPVDCVASSDKNHVNMISDRFIHLMFYLLSNGIDIRGIRGGSCLTYAALYSLTRCWRPLEVLQIQHNFRKLEPEPSSQRQARRFELELMQDCAQRLLHFVVLLEEAPKLKKLHLSIGSNPDKPLLHNDGSSVLLESQLNSEGGFHCETLMSEDFDRLLMARGTVLESVHLSYLTLFDDDWTRVLRLLSDLPRMTSLVMCFLTKYDSATNEESVLVFGSSPRPCRHTVEGPDFKQKVLICIEQLRYDRLPY